MYWDLFTPQSWTEQQKVYEAERKRRHDIETRTVDLLRLGEMQPERDHKLVATERSYVSDAFGRKGREARGNNHFSFEMKVDENVKNSLLLTYIGDDKGRKFDILIDGVKLTTVDWDGGKTGKFYDVEYPIPAELIKGKSKISIKIDAPYNKTAGRVFGAITIKSEK